MKIARSRLIDPIVVQVCGSVDAREVFVVGGWPEHTKISDNLLRASAPLRDADAEYLSFRYPFVTVRVANGHAVYRVETCEGGVWAADLVEGAISGNPPGVGR